MAAGRRADHMAGRSLVLANTSMWERAVTSRLRYAHAFALQAKRYWGAFRNPIQVSLAALGITHLPTKVLMRRGGQLEVDSTHAITLISFLAVRNDSKSQTGLERNARLLTISPDRVSFVYDPPGQTPREVSLVGIRANGDPALFFDGDYDWLPVSGRTVVDVGASIGESSIFFALRGASRVLSFEPYPIAYQSAKTNVAANGLSERVELRRAAVTGTIGRITLSPAIAGGHVRATDAEEGTSTPTTTLSAIVQELDRDDAILKMDCEGWEYDAILGSPGRALRAFSHIMLEYHYGSKTIASYLRYCGFEVRAGPSVHYPLDADHNRCVGYIYAERRPPPRPPGSLVGQE